MKRQPMNSERLLQSTTQWGNYKQIYKVILKLNSKTWITNLKTGQTSTSVIARKYGENMSDFIGNC